jgi:hypothetical protein
MASSSGMADRVTTTVSSAGAAGGAGAAAVCTLEAGGGGAVAAAWFTGTAGGASEVAVGGSAGVTGDCAEVDCHSDETALESGGLRIAERPRYQKTKAPCNSASTINSQTMDTSTPCGTGMKPMRRGGLRLLCSRAAAAFNGDEGGGAVCNQRGSLTVVSKVVVPERMPENLPAQPQQYLARSLLGVWHDSQNFVIRRTCAHHRSAVAPRC